MRTLYDLTAASDTDRFSPYCFRVKLAMQLKNLDYQSELVRFTEKDKLAFSGQTLVPVLRDGDLVICDSWKILQHLDKHYPQPFPLFVASTTPLNFFRHWCDKSLHVALFRLAAPYVHAKLGEVDQAYYRETREKRIGKSLEALAGEREQHMATLNFATEPLRVTLAEQSYLTGATPGLADLLVLSAFLWTDVVLPFQIFAADDPIKRWSEKLRREWQIAM
jgi:glutathione S-transferase